MKIRSVAKLGVAVIAIFAITSCRDASQPKEVTLRFAHFLPATSNFHVKVAIPWCQKIAKESNNRLKCQFYPAMQLGGTPAQLIDQARDGLADIVWTLPGYSAGRFPIVEVFELPFMMTTAEETSPAVWEFVQKHDMREFRNVKPLAFHVSEGNTFHMGTKPITQLSDFAGLKIRAPTRLGTQMLSALGATPVGMPMPQVPDALSKGVVDGGLMPWEVVPTFRIHELIRFHSDADPNYRNPLTTVFVIAMNKDRYAGLPPDLKKVIDANSGVETSAWIGKVFDSQKDFSIKLAKDRNNQINTIPSAELRKWEEATQPVIEAWKKNVSARGADGEALLKAARDLIAQYDK
jgi:TRAP-type transport system periplasmic protein